MSIATQSLKYGWVALATLTIGTATIFVAPSVLRRITLKDRIEVTLAIVERCLATQTGTNGAGEPVYGVDPPSIVRTWTDTNGASVIMTNALAWRDDLSMKIELDAKIEALCPYYVDTNSVYDGTTNIIMHTFTGLLTSLDLGDHTNFTAIPAIGTNIATYGPWAWRNYTVAWQERYKVLNALKITTLIGSANFRYKYGASGTFSNYADAVADAQAEFAAYSPQDSGESCYAFTVALYGGSNSYVARGATVTGNVSASISTAVTANVVYLYGTVSAGGYLYGIYDQFDPDGVPNLTTNLWTIIRSISSPSSTFSIDVNNSMTLIDFPPEPTAELTYRDRGYDFDYYSYLRNLRLYVDWQFLYATNKYW